jgi:hypothetical protein
MRFHWKNASILAIDHLKSQLSKPTLIGDGMRSLTALGSRSPRFGMVNRPTLSWPFRASCRANGPGKLYMITSAVVVGLLICGEVRGETLVSICYYSVYQDWGFDAMEQHVRLGSKQNIRVLPIEEYWSKVAHKEISPHLEKAVP